MRESKKGINQLDYSEIKYWSSKICKRVAATADSAAILYKTMICNVNTTRANNDVLVLRKSKYIDVNIVP